MLCSAALLPRSCCVEGIRGTRRAGKAAWRRACAGYRYRHLLPGQPPATWGGIIAPWALLQPIRLHLGYSGNLREKVPVLVAFFLMTFFISNVLNVYFMALQASCP